MSRPGLPKEAAKLRKLTQVAEELRQGRGYSITRLTTVKSLCQQSEAANRFVVHLARLTQQKMERRSCPSHLDSEKWARYKLLAAEVILQVESYLEKQSDERAPSLKKTLLEVEGAQNQNKNLKWGPVRLIESKELLLVENALRCLLSPHESAYWAYQVAKEYAEGYTPRYGSGLVPQSAPMVEEIADFWCRYHFGMPLSEWPVARQ